MWLGIYGGLVDFKLKPVYRRYFRTEPRAARSFILWPSMDDQ